MEKIAGAIGGERSSRRAAAEIACSAMWERQVFIYRAAAFCPAAPNLFARVRSLLSSLHGRELLKRLYRRQLSH
jgi:hypothetical protein